MIHSYSYPTLIQSILQNCIHPYIFFSGTSDRLNVIITSLSALSHLTLSQSWKGEVKRKVDASRLCKQTLELCLVSRDHIVETRKIQPDEV